MLGMQHCLAVAAAGGIPIILDVNDDNLQNAHDTLARYGYDFLIFKASNDAEKELKTIAGDIKSTYGQIGGLVNNASINPKVEDGNQNFSRLENFSLEQWNLEISVGLTGAMVCSRVFGQIMNTQVQGGVIVNIASDLSVIAPDQRLYQTEGNASNTQPVKPVTYSVIKHGLIGLTKYLATYFDHVRCNALSPGGVQTNQPEQFIKKLSTRIPMQRMARPEEYQAALVFLLSDASSYMTGQNLIIDGGRTVW